MTNFIEKIKDFLYDAIDYVLILVIIVGVAAIIGWRLDILFAKDMDKHDTDYDKTPITDIVENNKDNDNFNDTEKDNTDDNSNQETDNSNDNEIDENLDNDDPNNDNGDKNTDTDVETNTDEIITVKIPSGSLPPTIANILLEKGLIENKMEFLIKSQELKLDTKLKSGEFKINKNISLEDLIKTLAK